jgi:hypothetical protein
MPTRRSSRRCWCIAATRCACSRTAGSKVSQAIDDGADLVIINRFGQQEIEGKGLTYLIERALSAEIPLVIAVPDKRLTDWNAFSDGMATHLGCDRGALDGWWLSVSSARAEVA